MEVVQADGSARVRPLALDAFFEAEANLLPPLYGSVHADGRLSVAGLLQVDAIAVQGQVLGRIDGTVALDDESGASVLVADYQQRYQVELFGSMDATLDFLEEDMLIQTVDCRERIGLDLEWVAPLPTPLPGS
jgi:hypothetical protein